MVWISRLVLGEQQKELGRKVSPLVYMMGWLVVHKISRGNG